MEENVFETDIRVKNKRHSSGGLKFVLGFGYD